MPDDPFASCVGTMMLGANRAMTAFQRLVREGAADETEEPS